MSTEENWKERKDRLEGARGRVISILAELQDVYKTLNKDEFLSVFLMLGGDAAIGAAGLELMRYFDTSKKKFRFPSFRLMQKLDELFDNERAFSQAIANFVRGSKGSQGGLKRFREPLRDEKREKALVLQQYKNVKEAKSAGGLSEVQKRMLSYYERTIPQTIRDKVLSVGYKKLAIRWMLEEYPCTESTLVQIISRRPKKERLRRHATRESVPSD